MVSGVFKESFRTFDQTGVIERVVERFESAIVDALQAIGLRADADCAVFRTGATISFFYEVSSIRAQVGASIVVLKFEALGASLAVFSASRAIRASYLARLASICLNVGVVSIGTEIQAGRPKEGVAMNTTATKS